MADAPAPRRNPLVTAALVAAGGLGALALASRRSGIFGTLDDGTAPFGRVLARAGLGALVGIAVGFGVVAVLRATNHRHRLVEDASAAPSWRRVLAWSAPLVLLLAVLGAAAGSATTPLEPRTPAAAPDVPRERICGQARYVDLDRDGEPDLDADGQRVLVVDADCNGSYETQLRACPSDSGTYAGPARAPHAAPTITVPIDRGCDGTVDQWISIDERALREFTPATPQGGAGQDGGTDDASSPDRAPDLGGALRTLAILALIAVVLAAFYALSRLARRRPGTEDEEATPGEVPDEVTIDHDAAADTIEDSITAVLTGGDPRAAVLAAYAILLDGLAAAGLPRLPHEAPDEHLRRCLQSLHVRAEPMVELVRIFSLARFSDHPVTEQHRADALAALRAAQLDLTGALAGQA